MNLTYFTNYSLRVMMYLGLNASSLTSISRISEAFAISRNHLIKVVHNLARQGFIKTVRGRGGGLRLARDPGEINLGDVVRKTEANFRLVECFDPAHNTCPLTPACQLKCIMREAEDAFVAVLDRYTLADLLGRPRQMSALLGITRTRHPPLWRQPGNVGRTGSRTSRAGGQASCPFS